MSVAYLKMLMQPLLYVPLCLLTSFIRIRHYNGFSSLRHFRWPLSLGATRLCSRLQLRPPHSLGSVLHTLEYISLHAISLDHHIELLAHFAHERLLQHTDSFTHSSAQLSQVHAKAAGAHGCFELTHSLDDITSSRSEEGMILPPDYPPSVANLDLPTPWLCCQDSHYGGYI